MKLRTFILLLLSATLVVGLNSCRPRSQKTAKKQTKKPPTDTTKQNAPTAKSVMSRADSVLANLSALTAEERDMPQVTPSDYVTQPAPQDATPDASGYKVFESGLASFNASDYQAAIGAFSQIASSGRPPELVPNAYYWIGESYYGMNRFAESIPYFEYTAQAGPAYKRETAFYKIAMASSLAGNDEAASTWTQRLRAEYPKSKYVKLLKKAGVE